MVFIRKNIKTELSNENIAVSEPTGSGTTNVFENDAVKVNIYYLKYNDYTKLQYKLLSSMLKMTDITIKEYIHI